MNVLALIPARYGSTRLPGKPLLARTGWPLIQHVWQQVRSAGRIDRCIVATDDERIVQAVESFGGEARLTRGDHVSGTDRIAEVVAGLPGEPEDVILNVQGDEPEIEPASLDRLVGRLLADASRPAATLACPFSRAGSAASRVDPRDPNCVKVVCNRRGDALYFSRSLIPYPRDDADAAHADGSGHLLHLGVYGYRRWFLLELSRLPPGSLERIEKLEQLRILEHGYPLAVEVVDHAAPGIDTPQDYEDFVRRWQARQAGGASGTS